MPWKLFMSYILLLWAGQLTAYADGLTGFTLVDAATGADLNKLINGDTINLQIVGVQLNIRANTNGPASAKVVFSLDGKDNYRTETEAPFTLAGDSNGNYNSWTPSLGLHTLTATPYTNTGEAGTPLTITFLVVARSLSGGSSIDGTGKVTVAGDLKKWHKITLLIDGPASDETAVTNPFLQYRLNVTFTNGTRKYLVPGYFAADGMSAETSAGSGTSWKVHFTPDEIGTWTYSISMRTGMNIAVNDDLLTGTAVGNIDGQTGTFVVAATDKNGLDLRGKGRLNYTGEHYLQFAETGEYFLKGGVDSPENFLAYQDFDNTPDNGRRRKSWSPHLIDWKEGDPGWKGGKGKGIIGAVNYLASQGLNAFSFLTMNINGDDKNVYPYLTTTDFTRFDCSKLDQWEIVFDHADKMGMYLHVKTQETENNNLLDGGNVGIQRKLYYRELIARFSHHLAMNWNVGEENTQTDQQRKDMAAYIWEHDPYKHPIVVHTNRGQQNKVYTPLLGNASNYTGASVQTDWFNVYEETRKWVENSARAGRKWVVANDEQGSANAGVAADADYTGNRGLVVDNQDSIRRAVLWGNLMASGAGVEYYFGYDTGETDLTAQDYRSRAKMWRYTRYALEFFKKYVPLPTLKRLTNTSNGWLLGKEGDTYLIYLNKGGSTAITLPNTASYRVQWYDPRQGGDLQTGSVGWLVGGGSLTIGNPPSAPGEDWVALIRRQDPPLAVSTTGFSEITAFPNPTAGTLTISGIDTRCATLGVSITNGSLMYRPAYVITSSNRIQLSLQALPAGNYLVCIDQCGKEYTQKIIVNY